MLYTIAIKKRSLFEKSYVLAPAVHCEVTLVAYYYIFLILQNIVTSSKYLYIIKLSHHVTRITKYSNDITIFWSIENIQKFAINALLIANSQCSSIINLIQMSYLFLDFSFNARVSIVEFIVGNIVEFMNVTMNMKMNPTYSDKVSEYNKKKKVLTPIQN